MNYFKTTILLIALTLLLVWVGSMVGGRQGAMFAFAIAMGMNFFSYWFSDKIVLKMYGARIVSEQESPDYYTWFGSSRIGRHAHAENLHHSNECDERLCNGEKSPSCCGSRHRGDA